jgi:hypothetical protein
MINFLNIKKNVCTFNSQKVKKDQFIIKNLLQFLMESIRKMT